MITYVFGFFKTLFGFPCTDNTEVFRKLERTATLGSTFPLTFKNKMHCKDKRGLVALVVFYLIDLTISVVLAVSSIFIKVCAKGCTRLRKKL